MTAMIQLRKLLMEFAALPDQHLSNKKSRKLLMPALVELQLAMKTELGVVNADGFHNPRRIQHLRESLEAEHDGEQSDDLSQ
jgi:hypothetical protein